MFSFFERRLIAFFLLFSFGLNVYAGTYDIVDGQNNTAAIESGTHTLRDPGGASDYGNNQNGSYTFTTTSGKYIQVEFTTFDMEDGYDYVYTYDGSSTSSPLMNGWSGTWTGNKICYVSSGASITVEFDSDFSVSEAGFVATISLVDYPGNEWNGDAASTDMEDGDNWISDNYPVVGANVYIPAGPSIFPVVPSSSLDYNNVTIESGATLDISGDLYLYGDLTNDGTLNGNASYDIVMVEDNIRTEQVISGTGTWGSDLNLYVYDYGSAVIKFDDDAQLADFYQEAGTVVNLNGYTVVVEEDFDQLGDLYLGSGTIQVEETTPNFTNANLYEETGTVYFAAGTETAAKNQTIPALTCYNLKVRNNNGFTVTQNAVTVNGDYEIINPGTSGGDVSLSGDMDVAGTISIGSGCELNANSTTINCGGSWSDSGTFNEDDGTVIFDGGGTKGLYCASVNEYGASVSTIITETFDSSIPGTWSTSTTGSHTTYGVDWQWSTGTWSCNYTTDFISSSGGGYVLVDSDCDGVSGMSVANSFLVTESYDFSNYEDVTVSFEHYYEYYSSDNARFQYKIGAGSWTTVQTWTSDQGTEGSPALFSQLISALDGQSDVSFRWRYRSGWDAWWFIDDFLITGVPTSGGSSITGETFNNLTITGGGTVVLSSHIAIDNTVTLTSGFIQLEDKNIYLPNGVEFASGSSTAMVVSNSTGYIQVEEVSSLDGEVLFPLGATSSNYNPITLTNNGVSDNFQVRLGTNVYENGTSGNTYVEGVIPITWYVSESSAGGSDVTMKMQWNATQEQTGFTRADAVIQHYSGGSWSDQGSGGYTLAGANPYTLEVSNCSSFSPQKVSNVSEEVLPVELIQLEIHCESDGRMITWSTASEDNNDFFALEKSVDGFYFEPLATIDGNDYSTEIIHYEYLDEDFNAGTFYYKLSQYDNNGDFEVFDIISSSCDGSQINEEFNVFSMKQDGLIGFNVTLPLHSNYQILVYETNGKLIRYQSFDSDQEHVSDQIDFSNQSNGLYIVTLVKEDGSRISKKLIWR